MPGTRHMLNVGRVLTRDCQGVRRREFLRVGSAGFAGLTLANLLRAEAAPPARARARAESCIFIYLAGGPSHHEMSDIGY